jgi:adenylate kinase family enzyme
MKLGKRISIVGTSCSGKTTLGKKLARLYQVPFMDIDDAYWLPGWIKADTAVLHDKINRHVTWDSWVIVGNGHFVNHTYVWPTVDTLIWIDLPLPVLLWRGVKRSLLNIVSRRKLCNGNVESVGRLLSKNSIVYWILSSFGKRKRLYREIFATKPYPCQYVHLQGVKAVSNFLQQVS